MITPIFFIGLAAGIALAAVMTLLFGVYTIGPTERGVLTTFGRAPRLNSSVGDDPELGPLLTPEELPRYNFPLIHVVKPGGPYFKWPWQRLYRIDMTIQTTDIIWDPDVEQSSIEAVTKDNLTISLTGQIRWKPCERNLYGYLFGSRAPEAHVMGYNVMENILQAQPKIDAVYCFNDEMAMGALAAIKAAKRTGIVITGMDANKDAVAAVKSGEITMTISLPPSDIGSLGVVYARWLKNNELSVPVLSVMPVSFITK